MRSHSMRKPCMQMRMVPPMNESQDVIKELPKPFNPDIGIATRFKNSQEAAEKGRKGGLSRSKNKSIGAELRYLKTKGLDDENSQRLYRLLTDKDADLTNIKAYMESLRGSCKTAKEKALLIKLMIDFNKHVHGTKDKHELVYNDIEINNTHQSVNLVFEMPKEFLEVTDGTKDKPDQEASVGLEKTI